MYLFILSQNAGDYDDAANVLFGKIKKNDRDQKRNFNEKNCFAGMSEQDLQSIMLLGHTDGTADAAAIEGFTADKFVENFEKNFKTTRFAKTIVKDVYIVGCEVGKKNAAGKSLAQEIAEKLYKKGFINVVIHAVAEPNHIKDVAGMRVSVTTKKGAVMGSPEIGDIAGYWLSKAQEDKIIENEKEIQRLAEENEEFAKNFKKYKEKGQDNSLKLAQNKAKITKLKLENESLSANVKQMFYRSSNVVADLNKPDNCFVHPQSPRRIEALTVKMSVGQQAAIDAVKARIQSKSSKVKIKKSDRKTIAKLQNLLKDLQEPTENWQAKITEVSEGFKSKFGNKKLPTKVMLLGLINNDVISDNVHMAKPVLSVNSDKNIKTTVAKPASNKWNVISEDPQQKVSKHEISERTPLLQTDTSTQQLQPLNEVNKQAPDLKDTSVEKIKAYVAELENGIKQRKKGLGCMSLFWPGMKNYKAAKLNKLVERIEQNGADWKQHVQEARKNRWLVAGFSTRNTRNLLDNILQDEPLAYISPPALRK